MKMTFFDTAVRSTALALVLALSANSIAAAAVMMPPPPVPDCKDGVCGGGGNNSGGGNNGEEGKTENTGGRTNDDKKSEDDKKPDPDPDNYGSSGMTTGSATDVMGTGTLTWGLSSEQIVLNRCSDLLNGLQTITANDIAGVTQGDIVQIVPVCQNHTLVSQAQGSGLEAAGNAAVLRSAINANALLHAELDDHNYDAGDVIGVGLGQDMAVLYVNKYL
jgi:hypothetical protein